MTATERTTARYWITVARARLAAARLRTEFPGIAAHQATGRACTTTTAVQR